MAVITSVCSFCGTAMPGLACHDRGKHQTQRCNSKSTARTRPSCPPKHLLICSRGFRLLPRIRGQSSGRILHRRQNSANMFFGRCGRLAIYQPFSDVLRYGTCRKEFALPGRRSGRDAPDCAAPCRRAAGHVRALRPVWQGGLCGRVAGVAGRGSSRGRAPGRILAAVAQPGCVRRQPGQPGGLAGR